MTLFVAAVVSCGVRWEIFGTQLEQPCHRLDSDPTLDFFSRQILHTTVVAPPLKRKRKSEMLTVSFPSVPSYVVED